jgi:TRAP-type C4-dicarboxylate transport system permease large subunit
MYTWPFTVLVWYMYINNNNNKRYHRNRNNRYTVNGHVNMCQRYRLFLCFYDIFIIIIINVHVPDQYSERSCIHVSEVAIVSLFLYRSLYWSGTCTLIIIIIKDIIETEKQSIPLTHVYMTVHCTGLVHIIINVHVPDQYSERSCIHGSEVLIASLFLWYLLLLLSINTSDTCIHDRSLY